MKAERGDIIPLEVRQDFNSSVVSFLLERNELPHKFHWYELLEQDRVVELQEVFGSRVERLKEIFNRCGKIPLK